MKLSKRQQLFTHDVSRLIDYIFKSGYACTLSEAYRTQEQANWYAEKGIGIKNSLHCQRLAIDINLFNSEGDYLSGTEDHRRFGEYWESLSSENRWGGNFNDGNHYERNK